MGRPLILGDPEAPSPPILKQKFMKGEKSLPKTKGKKKKGKKRKRKKKKEGKKEKITLCFLLKSTKCNIYRYHTDLGPGRGGSGPVKHREEGRRGQFRAGEGASGPIPSHHSILPMTTSRGRVQSGLPQPHPRRTTPS